MDSGLFQRQNFVFFHVLNSKLYSLRVAVDFFIMF
jgi:hypothetical protein